VYGGVDHLGLNNMPLIPSLMSYEGILDKSSHFLSFYW